MQGSIVCGEREAHPPPDQQVIQCSYTSVAVNKENKNFKPSVEVLLEQPSNTFVSIFHILSEDIILLTPTVTCNLNR